VLDKTMMVDDVAGLRASYLDMRTTTSATRLRRYCLSRLFSTSSWPSPSPRECRTANQLSQTVSGYITDDVLLLRVNTASYTELETVIRCLYVKAVWK